MSNDFSDAERIPSLDSTFQPEATDADHLPAPCLPAEWTLASLARGGDACPGYPELNTVDYGGQLDLHGFGLPGNCLIMGYRPYYSASQDDVLRSRLFPAEQPAGFRPAGYHFGVDPNTGSVRLMPDVQTSEFRPHDRDAYATRGYHYAVDPNSGRIARMPNVQTDEYRPHDRDAYMARGYHYAVDPNTGRIVYRSNVETQAYLG